MGVGSPEKKTGAPPEISSGHERIEREKREFERKGKKREKEMRGIRVYNPYIPLKTGPTHVPMIQPGSVPLP